MGVIPMLVIPVCGYDENYIILYILNLPMLAFVGLGNKLYKMHGTYIRIV